MTPPRDLGLYIHVPFCRQRCHFCAFYLEVARSGRIDAFSSALGREIEIYRRQDLLKGRPLQSIYFGGGTPTAIPVGHLVGLLELVQSSWPSRADAEVTVEAHPSTVTPDGLAALADAGFNRISFGVESMSDKDLAPLGRAGTVQDTRTAVAAARAAGFWNINLDLMYGLPGQTMEAWTETVHSLLTLDPSHVSCYALTVEDGTKLAKDVARGSVPKPDEALQIDMESTAETFLAEAGFFRYEISNYAKPGAACRHNQLYWTDGDYLGLGPSAQSYVDGVRFGNIAELAAYADLLQQQVLPVTERTILSTAEQQRDALVFGLRLLRGVPLTIADGGDRRRRIDDLAAVGWLELEPDRVRLTPLGRRYADTVSGELF